MNVSQTTLKSTVPVLRVTGLISRPLVQCPTVLRPSSNRAGFSGKAERSEVEKSLIGTLQSVRNVCWISFWSQLALSLSSAGVILFTIFATRTKATASVLLIVGVSASLISTGIARFLLQNIRSILNSEDVVQTWSKRQVPEWLLRNSDINLTGMAASIIALQNECGLLVAKLLRTSTTTVYPAGAPGGAPSSLDIFAVQGCANVLLSHFVSLFFVTYVLRLLERRRRNMEQTVN